MSTDTSAAGVGGGGTDHSLQVGAGGETLPVQEIVTGRGFVTGKSGAGKSNTVTVLLEELLDLGLPALVVDTDGEYHPLTDRYEVLHVGGDDDADTIVDEGDADRLAELAIGEGAPIILDVSAFADEPATALIEAVVRALFGRAKRKRRPFLLVVEEVQEYLPQRGSDDLSELLTTVAKRGRKYGLGILGVSQRPSSVDKGFITQANWMVWHRLTYDTDTKTAAKNLGKSYREPIADLDDGEAYLQADWRESITTLQLRKKFVDDAGATPDVAPYIDTPTAHDTDALLEALDADDDDEMDGGRAEYHRRAAERLAADVAAIRSKSESGDRQVIGSRVGLEPDKRQSTRAQMQVDTANDHRDAIAEIVADHGRVEKSTLYEEYRRTVGDPRGDRQIRSYLADLRDAGEVVATGTNSDREYYDTPDGLELPDHVTVREAVGAVRDAETVHDVQRELRVPRSVASKIASAFDGEVGRADAREFAHLGDNAESQRVTARVPVPYVNGLEKAVSDGIYHNKSEAIRDALHRIVDPVHTDQSDP